MTQGRTIAGLAALAITALAAAQNGTYGAVSVGVFFPTDSDLRDALGDNWISFGGSRLDIDPFAKRNIGFDWNAASQERDGNKVFMFAGSVGLFYPLGQPGATTRPYAAVRGGLSYIDYAIDVVGGRESAKRVGYNGNVELGLNIGDRLVVSTRYDLMPSYDGFNFSGLSFQVQYGIVKF